MSERSLQWYTGDVQRGAQGMTGYTGALYNGTQDVLGMAVKTQEMTGEGRGFSYGQGSL